MAALTTAQTSFLLPTPTARAVASGSPPAVLANAVHGTVVRVKQKPDGWGIITVDVNGAPEAWVGVMPPMREGMHVQGVGTYEDDKFRGGQQLRVETVIPYVERTTEGIELYLAGKAIRGIGKGLAKRIVTHFGVATIEVLDLNPDRLSEVKGITAEKAAEVAKAWVESRAEAAVAMFLLEHGATPGLAKKIVERYGKSARFVVDNEPYKLADDVVGIGFKKADEIAKKVGIAHDSPARAQAGVVFVLTEQTAKGHCYLPIDDLASASADLLAVSRKLVDQAINTLSAERSVIADKGPDGTIIYTKRLYAAETFVARKLITLRDAPLSPDASGKDTSVEACVNKAIKSFEKGAGIQLAPAQRQAVEAAARHKLMIITGGPGVGKSQALTSNVLTPTGWRQMGDLAVGDLVVDGATGYPVRVAAVYDRGELPIFRVTTDDGGSGLFCDEHLFLTKTRQDRADTRKVKVPPRTGSVKQLSEIRATLTRGFDDHANHSIPFAPPVHLEPRGDLPLDPWMLGAFLGDGHMGGATVRLNKPERDVQDRFVAAAPAGDQRGHLSSEKHVSVVSGAPGERSATSLAIEALGLRGLESHEKFIPEPYLYASIEQRIALLQGLCDTDGNVTGSARKCIEYSTASRRLFDDLLFLLGTLGARVAWNVRPTYYTQNGVRHEARLSYRVTFAFPHGNIVPVSSVKHLAKWNHTPNRVVERFIRSVEPEGTAPCRCIALDSESHLYVTDDFIVTHNTAVTRAVLNIFTEAQVPVKLAAPTGRAAKRMSEATGHPATTIHRLLGLDQKTRGFLHHEGNPLKQMGALVIDEASMCDVQLTRDLLAATPDGTRVIFVGDVDQLPSVGPGAVLRDMISSEAIHTVRLTQIFRQAEGSQITEQAHRINHGEVPIGDKTAKGEFYWIERDEQEEAAAAVLECATDRITNRFGISAEDIQVLTPMHKGAAGTIELNRALQAALNPTSTGPELLRGEHRFRINDRVIQKKNDSTRDVYNGDIGRIVSIEPENADRIMTVLFDGRLVNYSSKELTHLKLAYALSTHSSQGGQFDAVIQVLLTAHYAMLSRNLIYTGVTRGKKLVVLVASRRAMRTALSEVRREDRRTMLRKRLQNGGMS